jgi:hypothetical protein
MLFIRIISTDQHAIGRPAKQNGCIIFCVGNLEDEKFCAFNEVSRMKPLGTIVHRLTELLSNNCQQPGNLYHNYVFKLYFAALQRRKQNRELIRNKLTRKQEQCVCYFC